MIKVGITGNIGSGKSTVARLFQMMGVPVFNADHQARVISEQNEVIEEIRKTFGNDVIGNDGFLDRKKLASIVFNDVKKLSLLNTIIHPRVRDCFIDWCTHYETVPYILHESAILFESGFADLCDKVIVVTAPQELRVKRIMQRDLLTREEILARMNNQWTEIRLVDMSDVEIVNDDNRSLIEQVKTVDTSLRANFNK
ncbi:MAG: dephospho-CoA kinase [Bacteroidota bacterium]|nr:dephospho-CoA kinase [Bacteroidota bacterium]